METQWHHSFNPQAFLKGIKINDLLSKNEAYAENKTDKLRNPCLLCQTANSEGLVLNDKSYLCKGCFERVALIQYPEKYEFLRREYLTQREARKLARRSLIEKSFERRCKSIADAIFGFSCLASFFLLFQHIWLIIAVPIAAYYVSTQFEKEYNKKLQEWDNLYPEPTSPKLYHFHDPLAELTSRDKVTLHIFDHWPGYPPFWSYLREVVLAKDGRRCQVTGCPSRLELHIHHIKPVSDGGRHSPDNLVSLCDFHHALEPERGHERIWGRIDTRYFTLVREHARSNRARSGHHFVKPHLRRLQLITLNDLRELTKIYGFSCPNCNDAHIKFTLFSDKNLVQVECPACVKSIEGPQQLTEETGPRLGEMLKVTRNEGRWHARWDMLSERKESTWSSWKKSLPVKSVVKEKRKRHGERLEKNAAKPVCPKCGAATRLIHPRPSDKWKQFWGCTQFRLTGCKGSVSYTE